MFGFMTTYGKYKAFQCKEIMKMEVCADHDQLCKEVGKIPQIYSEEGMR